MLVIDVVVEGLVIQMLLDVDEVEDEVIVWFEVMVEIDDDELY